MPPRSTAVPPDSGPVPLEGKRLMKFDPTFNTGTIVQIAVVVASAFAIYTGIRTDQVQTKADLDQVKAIAIVERAQTAQSLAKIEASVSKLQDSNQDIKESLAILRGRAAEPRSGK